MQAHTLSATLVLKDGARHPPPMQPPPANCAGKGRAATHVGPSTPPTTSWNLGSRLPTRPEVSAPVWMPTCCVASCMVGHFYVGFWKASKHMCAWQVSSLRMARGKPGSADTDAHACVDLTRTLSGSSLCGMRIWRAVARMSCTWQAKSIEHQVWCLVGSALLVAHFLCSSRAKPHIHSL